MRKLFLLLASCLCLTGCSWILIGVAVASAPDPMVSFWAHKEYFKVNGEDSGTFRVMEVFGEGFAIAYSRSGWDTDNSLDGVEIGLNCGFFDGELKKGFEYNYNLDDGLDTYPIFKYTYREPVATSQGEDVYHVRTAWFNAVEGWFKITKMNKKKGIMSGRFEFKAVSDDPSSDEVIEVTNGVFRDIPYTLVSDK